MKTEAMRARLESLRGHIGFYAEDTVTGETLAFHADEPVVAASVIKLCVLTEAFRQREAGILDFGETVRVTAGDKKPSCGALTYLHDGVEVTVRDLVAAARYLKDLYKIFGDWNLVIAAYNCGPENINRAMADLGLSEKTKCRRKLFEPELSARGIQNHVTAADIGLLLKRMLRGEAVSPEASAEMLGILRDQRLNGKMPFHLKPRGIACAHKTGEDYDDGITHDVGIIYAEHPILFCFLAEGADVPAAERALQDLALMAADI